jgi:uncharacterized protein (TIGR03083 family)
MNKQQCLDHIRTNRAYIAHAAGRDDLGPTPKCPGWTVGHVVVHAGRAFRWMEEIVRTRTLEPLLPQPHPEGTRHSIDRLDPGLVPWFEMGRDRFVATLTGTDEDEPVWSWAGDNRAGFWLRLQAHETAIHRTDAQSAFGTPEPIEADLAVDTIDGLLQWFLSRARMWSMLPCRGRTLRFQCTDGNGAWQIRIEDTQAMAQLPEGDTDVTARGTASDLLLLLWQRQGTDRLEIEGDRTLIDRYRELVPLP